MHRVAAGNRLVAVGLAGLLSMALWGAAPGAAAGEAGETVRAGSGAGTAGTTLAVDTTVDGVDASPGDGQCATAGSDCTLRAAIQEANAWAGADTITLPAGTYTLTIAGTGEDAAATGDLDITEDLTITGAGDTVTAIDGNSLDTVLHILAPTVVVELTGLEVTGGSGSAVGGIRNRGTLTLTGCTVSSNYGDMGGGGIDNDGGSVTLIDSRVVGNQLVSGMGGAGIMSVGGSLTVIRSLVAENGDWSVTGGIRSWGSTALVIDSTITGNDGEAGGIFNGGSGTMTIVGSTVTGNIGGRGAGIQNEGGTVTVANSTISGNTAPRYEQKGGGVSNLQGTVTLANVTITGNTAGTGGGVYKELGALVEVRNTIIWGNSAADGPDCFGNLTSQDYNLIGETANCTLSGATGNNLTGVDPLLGPLQDNGGLTDTHALQVDSPALDSGNPAAPGSGGFACEATDQRGVVRPEGVACDIGAYELVLATDALPGETRRVSVASDGSQGNDGSFFPAISGEGRYLAFESWASNLVAGDTNSWLDVFWHDTVSGVMERVSVASDGSEGDHASGGAAISGDGRYVAFDSFASSLVAGDSNGVTDVFRHDTVSGVTERVSVATDGTQGNEWSGESTMSGDGRYLAFASAASNLVAEDTNNTQDVFWHDTVSGETRRVSVASDGTQGNGGSYAPAMSGDGRYVAFHSSASNLVGGDSNGTFDVFWHDTVSGVTERVSVASDGSQGNGDSASAAISGDGRYLAFESAASNLVAGDTNNTQDVFWHDTVSGVTRRVSVASGGSQSNGESWFPAMSGDGRYVAFDSRASNLVAGDSNGTFDVFWHDTATGETRRVSVASDGTQANDESGWAAISGDGRRIAFHSWASNLVAGDSNGYADVFLRVEPAVFRLAGADRFATAAAISEGRYPQGAGVVVVTTGFNFPDALAGGPAAAAWDAPILLVTRDGIPAVTAAELARLRPAEIVILGGSGVVSEEVAVELGGYAGVVRRLWGMDRFATAAAISADRYPQGAERVVVATGLNFPDALAGGPAAAAWDAPILLVTRDEIPAPTAAELGRLQPAEIVILGGSGVVSEQVAAELASYAGVVRRLWGMDRFATAAAISGDRYPLGAERVVVTTGLNFPDALAGGPAAAGWNAPILLVTRDAIPAATATELVRLQPTEIVILGGSGVVSFEVAAQLATWLR